MQHTHLVGVIAMTVREVRGTPTADLGPDIVSRRDDEGKYGQQEHGVHTVEAVTESVARSRRITDIDDGTQ